MNDANLNSIDGAGEQRSKRPRVVIVGGGFGGLAAAKALGKAPVEVILIDRTNHHVFQPLLYQVATSVLAPSQMSSPIREVLRRHKNTTVIMGEVIGVDKAERCVFVTDADRENVPIRYDYLILATGARHSYFGHNEFEKFAPGLKSLADAVGIRNKILSAFEQAEAEENVDLHRELLTFVLVGAGPTGVEMAAALAIFIRTSLRSEFRRIDPTSARIVLIDAARTVLGTFATSLSEAAELHLQKLGVEIHLGHAVEKIDSEGVIVGGERIASKTVIWTAGVTPSPAGKWLGVETDRAGRVRIQPDLRVPGNPEIFVIGDTASLDQDGKPLAGVAQVAMQQGRYAGKLIRRQLAGRKAPKPFRYFDKGTMAVIGKGYAVLQSGKVHLHGLIAWLAWAFIHITFLAQLSLKISVLLQWGWLFLTGQRGSRLIVHYQQSESAQTTPPPAATPSRGAQPAQLETTLTK
ncbi:MAG TPA: NAD(P)/FAD-dependent oxidoreductase [Chthoniobacterales bacterium]|nr:NAD(P)/FAD-dependent oxidoreductase [Chthoniobacterales bacterium]